VMGTEVIRQALAQRSIEPSRACPRPRARTSAAWHVPRARLGRDAHASCGRAGIARGCSTMTCASWVGRVVDARLLPRFATELRALAARVVL
jgi:hypothetical protein